MGVVVDGKANAIHDAVYQPGVQDTGDLSGGGYVVVAGAEQAVADFTVPLTIPAPADGRWQVNSIAMVLGTNVTVADGNLRIRVYVDVQDADHRVLDMTIAGLGPAYDSQTTSAAVWGIPAAFALLSDGLPHDILFFLWKDGIGAGATINVLELFEGVGSDISIGAHECMTFTGIRGLATVSGLFALRFGGMGAEQTNIVYSPAGTHWWGDVLTFGPAAVDQPLSLVEGGGRWINTRPVHALGSLGFVTQALTQPSIVIVDYIRLVWNDIE